MTEPTSDQKYYMCLTALKKLEETVGGNLKTELIKHSDGRVLTRYTFEYEEDD